MKRMGLVGAAAFAAVVGLTLDASATTRWKNQLTTGDWNVAANWTDGVPAANGEACFYRPSGTNFLLTVTPPTDFTGTIIVSNNIAGVSGDSYQNSRFYLMLSLNVLDGAQWKVKGNGHLVATEGIAERVDPAFVGLIEVRKGTSFIAPSTLNSSVSFIGTGTLTLTAASQVEQTKAFAGKVILPDGNATYSNTATLADHTVTLANGGTMTLEPNDIAFGSIRRFDFGNAGEDWSFNGTAWRVGTLKSGPYSPLPPYLRDDGVLMLTDDPAQVHSVWYTNRLFRATDDIGMKFTWTPDMPNPSRITKEGRTQTQSGNFSIMFQSASPTNVRLPQSMSDLFERSVQATNCWGFTMYTYQNEKNAHWSWLVNGSKAGTADSIQQKTTGIVLTKPIDFTVTVNRGVMTVTMDQGGESLSMRHDFTTAFDTLNAGGMYFGFGGCSDTWGESDATVGTPWVRHEVSNFDGWYRDPLEGGWEPIADEEKYTTIDEDHWTITRLTKASSSAPWVTNTGNACLNADGSFDLMPALTRAYTILFSKEYILDKTKPLKYSFDIYNKDTLFNTGNWPGLAFMLLGSNNKETNWDGKDNSSTGWEFKTWIYGFAFNLDLASGKGYFRYGRVFGTKDNVNNSDASGPIYTGVMRNDSARQLSNKDIRFDFLYDPRGSISQITSSDPRGKGNGGCSYNVFTLPDSWLPGFEKWKTERKSVIGLKSRTASTDYVQMRINSFRLLQMTSAEAGDFAGTLQVAANASASVAAGELMAGQTSRVATFGTADLAKGSALTVKPVTSATKVGVAKVVSAGGATLAAAAGASVSVGDIELTGADTDTGVTLSGAVALGGTLTVKVPAAWRKTRSGWVTLVDASAATGALPAAEAITLQTEDGVLPTKKYLLQVSDGKVKALFGLGMAILVR